MKLLHGIIEDSVGNEKYRVYIRGTLLGTFPNESAAFRRYIEGINESQEHIKGTFISEARDLKRICQQFVDSAESLGFADGVLYHKAKETLDKMDFR